MFLYNYKSRLICFILSMSGILSLNISASEIYEGKKAEEIFEEMSKTPVLSEVKNLYEKY